MMIINRKRLRPHHDLVWGPQKSAVQEVLDDVGIRAASVIGAGLDGLLSTRARAGFGILMYHRIAPVLTGLPQPTINVTPRRFREQIVGLLNRDFVFWPLRRVLALTRQGECCISG